ncbi:hypothetical protein DM02DRAFT_637617 [Periconia macrospinosa]|uniref:Tcp11-domain-containing protein n=1 Tax=Periconia macrospinosa TaxID=97972 RepID=A0A2V1EEL8_9PLEO|nr:hypothetical protein DM02DRAFT_637617 [Periconia macrospinosa]
MGAQTPETAGDCVPYRPAETYCSLPTAAAANVDDRNGVLNTSTSPSSPWNPPGPTDYEPEVPTESKSRSSSKEEYPGSTSNMSFADEEKDIPEQLADLLMVIISGLEGAELGDAFLVAADQPPVTKQSLGELDVLNIMNNITLRHDVNFDKDLSYRPNLDGPKGHEKRKVSDKFWTALVAELELYTWLFHMKSSISKAEEAKWTTFVQHAQRRIPTLFKTFHDILESLVPDRDHARLKEHFDVSMLMQEIQRGVCDLVKRVEWVATLLKEHCAPMRDGLVDKMVQTTRDGVATNNTSQIVAGLKELLGILEAMKLDVANHQVRNLKTRLIEETINFEKCYHLDRLVKGRSKVNLNAAQRWWMRISQRSQRSNPTANGPSYSALEVFTQTIVDHLFAPETDLPDTFHLDRNRLWVLQSEIDDLVHFEICFDVFEQCLKGFRYNGPVTDTARSELRNALSAIAGDRAAHTPGSWVSHSGALSLEIYRQATHVAGLRFECDAHELQRAQEHLQMMFQEYFSSYAYKVRAVVLSQVLACTNKYSNATPIELFNCLVTSPFPASLPLPPREASPQLSTNTLSFFADRLADITNRTTHIILLHWRVWNPIAYVTFDKNLPPATEHSINPPSPSVTPPTTATTQTAFDNHIDNVFSAFLPAPSPRHISANASTDSSHKFFIAGGCDAICTDEDEEDIGSRVDG